MRPIGFSTGALALADFRRGVSILREKHIRTVELSALRQEELAPLIESLETLDLSGFTYVSVHAPSRLDVPNEREAVTLLQRVLQFQRPIIIHPDVMNDLDLWKRFGSLLLVENMDKRKPIGRTASELASIFRELPNASFCFDLGHARQVDPTMSEATLILEKHASRLIQLHVSDVNTRSTHERLTEGAINAFSRISHLIPEEVPVILETPVSIDEIEPEIARTRRALSQVASAVAGD